MSSASKTLNAFSENTDYRVGEKIVYETREYLGLWFQNVSNGQLDP